MRIRKRENKFFVIGLTFIILNCMVFSAAESAIIKGPYLQNVTQTGIVIMWETDKPSLGKVVYGIKGLKEESAEKGEPVTIHEVEIGNLLIETSYNYQVFSGIEKEKSEVLSFKTAVKQGTPFQFVVCGDNRYENSWEGTFYPQVIESIIKEKPSIVLNTGDIVNCGKNYEEYERDFFGPGREIMKRVPFYVSFGNHELGSVWNTKFFSFPDAEWWYSFDYGNVHFIALDSNPWRDISPQSPQMKWLENDLKSNNQKWTVVFFHYPPFFYRPEYKRIEKNIVPFLEKYKVDVVFCGHNHHYTRLEKNGIPYIVTGGGGAFIGKISGRDFYPECFRFGTRTEHICVVDVNTNQMVIKGKYLNGKVFDTVILEKGKKYVAFSEQFEINKNVKRTASLKKEELVKKKGEKKIILEVGKGYPFPDIQSAVKKIPEVLDTAYTIKIHSGVYTKIGGWTESKSPESGIVFILQKKCSLDNDILITSAGDSPSAFRTL